MARFLLDKYYLDVPHPKMPEAKNECLNHACELVQLLLANGMDNAKLKQDKTTMTNKNENNFPEMSSSWTDELANAVQTGCAEARRLHRDAVGSGCLLLGLIRTQSSASRLLAGLGVGSEAECESIADYTLHEDSGVQSEEAFPVGGQTVDDFPGFSAESRRLLRIASLEARWAGSQRVGTEHLLLGILHDEGCLASEWLRREGITYEKISENLNIRPGVRSAFNFAEESSSPLPPNGESGNSGGFGQGASSTKVKQGDDTPMIDAFGTDLTRKAEEGVLDPVVGREKETLRMAQILCRRKKNNPILIGEPGAGKSAVVEGLASLIVARKAPHALLGKRIVALDMASVVAGTQFRGQFEERLRKLIEELKNHKEIILFIDEIHTIIGAGSAAGTLDAANILKPALARGEVQCIGATTTAEYRKTIEKDGALERRFQKISIEPTTAEQTLEILRNLKTRYEEHHAVTYTDDALKACVTLTERYINDRSLPDKAIDAMDEAGSRAHLTGITVPKEIEDKEAEIEALKKHKTEAAKNQDYELAARLRDTIVELGKELERMNEEWNKSITADKGKVDADDVAEVVSVMSGVPAGRMLTDEAQRLKGMKAALEAKVIDQDEAVERLVRAITRSRMGLKDENRPIGTFMFVGPTGVGKTHLVKTLAEWMFDRKDALIRVDMSEYGEKYSTSRLVGAPPGYVGYEEGGQLTERVRRHPYSVILLDEVEKAHPDVFNTLLQVMDEGRMTDGNGTTVDFRNTIIVMTSNCGTRQIGESGRGMGFGATPEVNQSLADGIIKKALEKQFAPEFLNRLDDIIVFHPLTKESAKRIAALEFDELRKRLEKQNLKIEVSPEVMDFIVDKGFDQKYGARSLKRAVQTYLEDPLCDRLIDGNPESGVLKVSLEAGKVRID